MALQVCAWGRRLVLTMLFSGPGIFYIYFSLEN